MSNNPINILYIEDSDTDYELMQGKLKAIYLEDLKLQWAKTLNDATKILIENRFDVILLDLLLPDAAALDSIQMIQGINPSIPIIVVTGIVNKDLEELVIARGIQDYILKDELNNLRLFNVIMHAIERNKLISRDIDEGKRYQKILEEIKSGNIQTIVGTDTPSGSVRIMDSYLIEENIRLIEKLAKSNEELEQFAYVVSHDFQAPLRTVRTFIEKFLEEFKEINHKQREYVNFILNAMNTLGNRIEAVLRLARISSGRTAFGEVSLNEIFKDVMGDLSIEIEELKAKIECDDLPVVYADPEQLKQLFQNLIGNALKFHGKETPIVHICAKRDERFWKISIIDNGIGIPAGQLNQLFLMFKRLHTEKGYTGTGIGLSICKKIVEKHGGTISVKENKNGGSTFTFTLPIRSQAEPSLDDRVETLNKTAKPNS